VIPADWKSDILRRVLFDPDTKTGADRSVEWWEGAIDHIFKCSNKQLLAIVKR
jgi:hypothetical protein